VAALDEAGASSAAAAPTMEKSNIAASNNGIAAAQGPLQNLVII
jgi:hypothetical protein